MPDLDRLPAWARERHLYVGLAVALAAGLGLGAAMRLSDADTPPVPEDRPQRIVEIPKEPAFSLPPSAAVPPKPVARVSAPEPAPKAEPLAPIRRWMGGAGPPVRHARVRARPSFDCNDARTLAEEMVCSDRGLAAADRRLARAYVRAQRAGVPDRLLRRQQDAWLSAREAAAHEDPAALPDVYEARIAELRDMAWDY